MAEREALVHLPITTKSVLRRNFDALISESSEVRNLFQESTSGSTGEPTRLLIDLSSRIRQNTVIVRNRFWLGIRQGETVAHLWGSAVDQARSQTARGRLHGWVAREFYYSSAALSASEMREYARCIQRSSARLLVGYPSTLLEFAEYCRDNGIRFPSLAAIVCSAESLYENQRSSIREAFGVPVVNRYGCREVGDIAQERIDSKGLLVNSDRILVELVGIDTPLYPGYVQGEVLLTDLDNFGMPLIRYRVGDVAEWASKSKENQSYPLLAKVEGRTLDVIRTSSGRRIGGTFFTRLLRSRPGIRKFQIYQPRENAVVVRWIPDAGLDPKDIDYLESEISNACGVGVEVRFESVGAIAPEPNGKYRLVKSEVSQS